MGRKTYSKNLPVDLLRVGLTLVFGYAAISQLAHPLIWIGYLPSFVLHFHATILVRLLAVYELGLVVWLLSGKFLKQAALVISITFAGILLSSLNELIITFRDVGLLFAALALYFSVKD